MGLLAGGWGMVARVTTVAFQGIEAVPVDVQVQITSGNPCFAIVCHINRAQSRISPGDLTIARARLLLHPNVDRGAAEG